MRYELYYWPTIQGRGEFVRLALEEDRVIIAILARGRRRLQPAERLLEVQRSEEQVCSLPQLLFRKVGNLLALVALVQVAEASERCLAIGLAQGREKCRERLLR